MKLNLTQSLKLTATAALLLLPTQTLLAKQFLFSLKVFSSSSSFYACNAGIRTIPVNYELCVNGKGETVPKPANCNEVNCKDVPVTCMSKGLSVGESHRAYMKANLADWTDNGVVSSGGVLQTKASAPNVFQTFFSGSDSYGKQLKDLSFELGNEIYSAQYFVDICYRGPQANTKADGQSAGYSVLTGVGSTDFLSLGTSSQGEITEAATALKLYTQEAGLKAQSFIVCDVQGQGQYQNGTNMTGQWNKTDNEAEFVIGNQGLPVGGLNGSPFELSAMKSMTGEQLGLINWQTADIRFCKVRYVFTETKSHDQSNGNAIFRKWERRGAQICTDTTINEPTVD